MHPELDAIRNEVKETYPNEEGMKDEFRIIGKVALNGSDATDPDEQKKQLLTIMVLAERGLQSLQPSAPRYGRVQGVPKAHTVPPVTGPKGQVVQTPSRARRARPRKKKI